MATSTSVAQFVGRMDKYQTAAKKAASLSAVTRESRAVFEREIRRASGGDMRLSKVGAKGAAVGVRTSKTKTDTKETVLLQASGPMQLLESKIKPHIITSKKYGGPRAGRGERVAAGTARLRQRSTQRREAVIRTPYGPRAYVRHPGVSNPKRPWAKAEKDVLKLIPRIQTQEFVKAMRNV